MASIWQSSVVGGLGELTQEQRFWVQGCHSATTEVTRYKSGSAMGGKMMQE